LVNAFFPALIRRLQPTEAQQAINAVLQVHWSAPIKFPGK